MSMRRVAVTGMGIISPVGNTLDEFWNNIINGESGIGEIKSFDTTDFKVKIAAEVKNFDPTLYIPKNEVRKTDLYAQYAIAAAHQAVQDSGIIGKVDSERLGVYVGSGIGGIQTMTEETGKLNEKGPRRVSPFFVPMMIGNIAAGTIAIKYNATGPTLPVVTACATSTNAIGEAFRAIAHGYADAIIAGGSEAAVCPISIAGFTNCMALSTRNDVSSASIPFDARRDGFVIGEGGAILVMEEYEHALERGAHIYGEIVGYGNTCDAHHITAPHPEAEGISRAIALAAKEGAITPDSSVYYNAHGTSTPLNDKTETLGLKKAFGDKAYDIAISSTKSMTGHMLGAAGAAEAIVCLKALEEGILPPTVGLNEKDPDCDLDYVPNTARKADITSALSASLGFGGHNACVAFRKAGKK